MAASMCRSYVENYVSGFEDSAAKDVSDELLQRKATITDIIEHLGCYLTNKETATRARATRLIADILHNIPTDFLTHSQVSLLVTYLCEKLKDHFSLQGHALYGILALSKSPQVSDELIQSVCQDIFREVHVQSLPQADRRSVYNIILNFLNNHLSDVQKMGPDFVYGYIQVMDSEKDPRNLVLAFGCALIIIQNFSLGVFVEEMFEVVSCYFPVDFSPSANDPSGIKKEDLVLGLRRCLAASPKFAQYCLPLLMEKLTSDLKSAKIDALETLSACLETYEAECLYEFQSSFFNCIKKEVINTFIAMIRALDKVFLSGDPVLEETALAALRAMVKNLSSGVTQNDRRRSLDGFIEEILTECKNHLLQPELMLMLSTGRLLQSAALGSDTACSQIVKISTPLLLESHAKQSQPTPRYNVVQVLTGFIECTAKFKYSDKNPNPILSAYKDPVLMIYTQAFEEDVTSLQLSAVTGFHSILSLPKDNLLDTERSFIATKLVLKSLQSSIEESVRTKCAGVLKYILSTFPEVQKSILPAFFLHFKNEPMDTDSCDVIDKEQTLGVLAAVTTGSQVVKQVLMVLCDTLQNEGTSLALFRATAKCLSHITQENSADVDCVKILLKVGATSVHGLIVSKCHCEKWNEKLRDDITLTHFAAFLRYLAFSCPDDCVKDFQSLFINSYLNNDSQAGDGMEQPFKPLETGPDCVFVSLLTPVLCAGPVNNDIPHQAEIVDHVKRLVLNKQEGKAHTAVCKCLATLINRHKQDESLDDLVSSLQQSLMSSIETGTQDNTLGHVEALYWITKALVLRNHKLAASYTESLLKLLAIEHLGHEAARGISVILVDHPDVLNKSTRSNIRLMYKQRFFTENLPKIVEGYSSTKEGTRKNYLLVLSYLIQAVSKQVLAPELPKIYPLLIQSLLFGDLDLQLATMATMGDLIHNCPELVSKQIDSLVPQLMKLITNKSSMKVRISALKCLKDLTVLPLHIILPYSNQIIRAIKPVLDDKKRLVRSQAVAARQEWYLLESSQK